MKKRKELSEIVQVDIPWKKVILGVIGIMIGFIFYNWGLK